MEKILLAQFIAHVIADFFSQPECISSEKQRKCLSSWHIYIHTLVVFIASLGLTFTCEFIWYAAAITISHFVIDALKCIIERWYNKKRKISEKSYTNHYIFLADQILHLTVIYCAVAVYWTNNHLTSTCFDIFTIKQLLTFAGILLCMKPTNVIIRSCLSSLNLYCPNEDKNDLERAGRWIGTVERIMALALVMLQQYSAIGFIIAAKSVLRYNDSKAGKTEYVLIGTLLSFSIAILIGIGINKEFFESFLNHISFK